MNFNEFRQISSVQKNAIYRHQETTITQKIKAVKFIISDESVRFTKLETILKQRSFSALSRADEFLYIISQTSRDQTFKNAFLECPTSKLDKIRSSHAYDAVAGDIKYHNSCWWNGINKRTPEI